ncbi:hypothetical protein MNBD_GAMMA15-435 [hydrothermal vent metagenome]|uniref:Glycosyltransferase 2-like domain-containing protein n=1 Tax=hydrothermal vent metagenome TaxID=652676 RepID=A0A3B0YAF7_9ZZZZ
MKVSVIIPTYNRAQLVSESIDSVLAQSYQNLEIIVIDDGSTDDTPSVLARYGDRITSIRQKNGGVNKARNRALEMATGEYIATLDNDDLWHNDKLALQVELLDQHPGIAYVYSNFSLYRNADDIRPNGLKHWHGENRDWNTIYPERRSLADLNGIYPDSIPSQTPIYFGDIHAASLTEYFVLPSSALIRRSSIPDNIRFIEHDPICGDWDFFARLSKGRHIAFIDFDTTYNRSHDDEVRLTRTSRLRQLEFRIDMLERLYLADAAFYLLNRSRVDHVYRERLLALALLQLLENETAATRDTLDKACKYRKAIDIPYLLLRLGNRFPGTGMLLRTARGIRRRFNA